MDAGGNKETLQGIGVSPGIALGRALVLEGPRAAVYRLNLDARAVEKEVTRFEGARRRAWRQLRDLRERVRREAGESFARVFDVQILILRDPAFRQAAVDLIRREQVNAEWALRTIVGRYVRVFAGLGDLELRERGTDVEDVELRVQGILAGGRRRHDLAELAEDVIIVAARLAPSDAAGLNRDRVVGLAIDEGGPTSHTAIIASAIGIPAVSGLQDASRRLRTGDRILLDGRTGTLVVNPDAETLAEWQRRRDLQVRQDSGLDALRDQPAVTEEGQRVRLLANLELPEEIAGARRHGAEGIGLYRSEFLYLGRAPDLPDEEDHYRVYRTLAERVHPGEVSIRTLDLGGEKSIAALLPQREANPVLGLRAIRLCLRHRDLFRTQLRAILRAGACGRVRVLFPMISGLEEFREARAVLDEARDDLVRSGIPCDPGVPLGVMIEVPSAAIIADRLAAEVDFLAIGTNDLIQYALAIDRGNAAVSYLYDPFHPAILRLIAGVQEAAARLGRPVSVCGEMAADPLAAAVLVGLGVNELSMNPAAIPAVKQMVRSLSLRRARAAVEEVLRLDTATAIRERMRTLLGPGEPQSPRALLARLR